MTTPRGSRAFGQAESPSGARAPRSWFRYIGFFLAALAVAVVWFFTPLRQYLDITRMAALGQTVRNHPAAPVLIVGAYLVAALIFFPMTLMLAATALVFDPVRGLLYGLTGALAAAIVMFAIGRRLPPQGVRWLSGPRLARLGQRLQRRGLLAMAIARVVPAGNFSLFNLAAGMLGIKWRDFVLGNIIGLLPEILVLTLLGRQVRALSSHPTGHPFFTAALVATAAAILALLALWIRRRRRRPTVG